MIQPHICLVLFITLTFAPYRSSTTTSSTTSSTTTHGNTPIPDIVILGARNTVFGNILLEAIQTASEICYARSKHTKHNCSNSQLQVSTRVKYLMGGESIRNIRFILILAEPIGKLVQHYTAQESTCSHDHSNKCNEHLPTFREYFDKNIAIVQDGYYISRIKHLLEYIPRVHLYIINADECLVNISQSLININKYLKINMNIQQYINNTQIIHSNTTYSTLLHNMLHKSMNIDCITYKYYKCRYDYYNAGLVHYINSNAYKPSEEPYFLDFIPFFSISKPYFTVFPPDVFSSSSTKQNCTNKYLLSDYNSTFDGPPDIFMIGVPKGGTTSLHDLLVMEDSKILAYEKEVHFFDDYYNNEYFNQYITKYNNIKLYNHYTIDSSPAYFSSMNVLTNMVSLYSSHTLKKKKFILLLREPFSRLVSWYQHTYGECSRFYINYKYHLNGIEKYCNKNQISLQYHDTFSTFKSRNGLWAGNYKSHLLRWLDIIPRKQIFIINMDTLYSNQSDSISNIYIFLNINYLNNNILKLPKSNDKASHCHGCNKTELTTITCKDFNKINSIYSERNEGLIDLINDAEDKPISEPYFPPFRHKLPGRCIGRESFVYE